LPAYLFDEIEKRFDEVRITSPEAKKSKKESSPEDLNKTNASQEARNIHHLAVFDAFNEALDLERPYKVKGMPNPWSKQTRMTNE